MLNAFSTLLVVTCRWVRYYISWDGVGPKLFVPPHYHSFPLDALKVERYDPAAVDSSANAKRLQAAAESIAEAVERAVGSSSVKGMGIGQESAAAAAARQLALSGVRVVHDDNFV